MAPQTADHLLMFLCDRAQIVIAILLLVGAQNIKEACEAPLATWMNLYGAMVLFTATVDTVWRMWPGSKAEETKAEETKPDEGVPTSLALTILKLVMHILCCANLAIISYGWFVYATMIEEACVDDDLEGRLNPRTLTLVLLILGSLHWGCLGSCCVCCWCWAILQVAARALADDCEGPAAGRAGSGGERLSIHVPPPQGDEETGRTANLTLATACGVPTTIRSS